MQKVGSLSWLNNRAVVEAAVIAALSIIGFVVLREFSHASAATGTLNATSLTTASDSSATSPAAADTSQSGGSSQTSLTVNGKKITVPQNGSVSQTVGNSDNGSTQVDVNSQQTDSGSGLSTGTATNHSSTTIHVSSNSSSVSVSNKESN